MTIGPYLDPSGEIQPPPIKRAKHSAPTDIPSVPKMDDSTSNESLKNRGIKVIDLSLHQPLSNSEEQSLLESMIFEDSENGRFTINCFSTNKTKTFSLGKLGNLISYHTGEEKDQFFSLLMKIIDENDVDTLHNLSKAEQLSIFLYSTGVYRLMNGFLENDIINLSEWLCNMNIVETRNIYDEYYLTLKSVEDLDEEDKKYLSDIEPLIHQLNRAMISGLNKIPSSMSECIYHGDALPQNTLISMVEELKTNKEQNYYIKKFFSCTTDKSLSLDFAKSNEDEYVNHDHETTFCPVIYKIEKSTKDKSIGIYSANPHEKEHVVPPDSNYKITNIETFIDENVEANAITNMNFYMITLEEF